MFKITLQISLYDQNLLRKKEDFHIKSDLIYSNIFFSIKETLNNFNTKF